MCVSADKRKIFTAATLNTSFLEEDFFENSFCNGKDIKNLLPVDGSANQKNFNTDEAAEKIEKLTKYLHNRGKRQDVDKAWEFMVKKLKNDTFSRWTNLQNNKLNSFECPKCLWQCGTIYVDHKIWKQRLFANIDKLE